MKIEVNKENGTVCLMPFGDLDYVTSPELDNIIEKEAPEADKMVLDFDNVGYISSAGLRSILNADDLMEDKGGIRLINVNKNVKYVLEMTNFVQNLDIEFKE